jgi:hypothetical protein
MREMPFHFEIPIDFFEKADAEPGKQHRIGGIVTTDNPDRQGEIILQQGLDFSDFLKYGWYNDNHTKETDGILGYPELVRSFHKGETLPSGKPATANGHWAEGYLLDTERAKKIWELGKALAKTNRRLGFSVEGGITKRTGPLRKTIAQAKVRNIAITNCPVNADSQLDILAKSLLAVERQGEDAFEKALGMGPVETPVTHPVGDKVGMGAGRVLAPQSLEQKKKNLTWNPNEEEEEADGEEPLRKEKVKKSLLPAEAVAFVQKRIPGITTADAIRIVNVTKVLKTQGRL